MPRRRPSHWTRQTFVAHAPVYAEVLRSMGPSAKPQVEGIRRILEQEGVTTGGRILDIACGIGRHIVPLGSDGYEVVGCDLSPVFIREARLRARGERLAPSRARFYVADYRTIARTLRRAKEPPFDAAICIFTSMGYRGRRTDKAVLRGVRRVVRPGGLMIFETGDRDSVLRRFQEVGINRYGTNLEVHERRRFARENSTMHSEWNFYRRGPSGHLRHIFGTEMAVRMYSLHELKHLFQEAGWRYRHAYGSLDTLESVSFESRRLVIVAQRPGSRAR